MTLSVSRKSLAPVALAFVVLVVIVPLSRTWLFRPDIQIDEPHWASRSKLYMKYMREGDVLKAINQLTHPAWPTNLIFGYGYEACRLTRVETLQDRINCGRLINSILQGLTYLAVVCLLQPYFGPGPAILGTTVAGLTPYFTGIGSIMHLDCFLGFLFALYLVTIRNFSTSSVVLAGVLLGLALLTKISGVIFVVAATISLVLCKRFYDAVLCGLTALLTFHLLPSLWYESFRYQVTNYYVTGLYITCLVALGAFLLIALRIGKVDVRPKIQLSMLCLITLVSVYFFEPIVFKNLTATIYRVNQLKDIPHENTSPGLLISLLAKLTPADILSIIVSSFLILRRRVMDLLPALIALLLFFIPEKQAVRYAYPALLPLTAYGLSFMSSNLLTVPKLSLRFFLSAFALALNPAFLHAVKDCAFEYSTPKVLGFSEHRNDFPTCGISSTLESLINKHRVSSVSISGYIEQFKIVADRAKVKVGLLPYPYLGNTPHVIAVDTDSERFTHFFTRDFLNATDQFFVLNYPLLGVYTRTYPENFPVRLSGRQLSAKLTVKKECEENQCFYWSSEKKLDFYVPLSAGFYSAVIMLRMQDKSDIVDLSVKSRNVVIADSVRKDEGSLTRLAIYFTLTSNELVNFQVKKRDFWYSDFIIDVADASILKYKQ